MTRQNQIPLKAAAPKATIGLVCAGFAGGQRKSGVETGPAALLEAGLCETVVKGLKRSIQHDGQIHNYKGSSNLKFNESIKYDGNMRNPHAVSEATRALCEQTYEQAKKGNFVLTLGGDHSIAIGSIAGISKAYQKHMKKDISVVWVDAHADINTPETSETGNIHGMPLAILTGLIRTSQGQPFSWVGNLSDDDYPILNINNLVYIGLRDVDPGEQEILRHFNIKAFTRQDVQRLGIEAVVDETLSTLGEDAAIHLSFDIDSLDPDLAPATGTPVHDGLTLKDGIYVAERLHDSRTMVSMDLVEINPLLSPGQGAKQTVEAGMAILTHALGSKQ